MRHDMMPPKDEITNHPNTNSNGNNAPSTYLRLQQSQAIRANIQNISQLLNTGLSAESLDICVRLCEAGVHPQALAEVVNQIRREIATIQRDD